MTVNEWEKINEMLEKEVEKISQKSEISDSSLENLKKLVCTIECIHKIIKLDGEISGYSQNGSWNANIRGSYDRPSGYNRMSSSRHYPMTGYSNYGDSGDMYDSLQRMMSMASTDQQRDAIARCMDTLR